MEKKCGFKEYGRRRKCRFIDGRYYDAIEMDILDEEFTGDFIRNKSIENGFLNNINMSINIDINDSIRFNIEDSVLYVTLNKEFFYFLNSNLTEFKDFFFNKVLLNLFNFFTEDNVFNSMLYNNIHDQIVSSNHNKINKDNYVF